MFLHRADCCKTMSKHLGQFDAQLSGSPSCPELLACTFTPTCLDMVLAARREFHRALIKRGCHGAKLPAES